MSETGHLAITCTSWFRKVSLKDVYTVRHSGDIELTSKRAVKDAAEFQELDEKMKGIDLSAELGNWLGGSGAGSDLGGGKEDLRKRPAAAAAAAGGFSMAAITKRPTMMQLEGPKSEDPPEKPAKLANTDDIGSHISKAIPRFNLVSPFEVNYQSFCVGAFRIKLVCNRVSFLN